MGTSGLGFREDYPRSWDVSIMFMLLAFCIALVTDRLSCTIKLSIHLGKYWASQEISYIRISPSRVDITYLNNIKYFFCSKKQYYSHQGEILLEVQTSYFSVDNTGSLQILTAKEFKYMKLFYLDKYYLLILRGTQTRIRTTF